jgi:hypothetical protein
VSLLKTCAASPLPTSAQGDRAISTKCPDPARFRADFTFCVAEDSNLCISGSEFVKTLSSGREKSNMRSRLKVVVPHLIAKQVSGDDRDPRV